MAEGREAGRAIASRVGPVGDGRRHEAGRATAGLGRVADARGAWSRARGAGRSIASLGRALAGFRGTEGTSLGVRSPGLGELLAALSVIAAARHRRPAEAGVGEALTAARRYDRGGGHASCARRALASGWRSVGGVGRARLADMATVARRAWRGRVAAMTTHRGDVLSSKTQSVGPASTLSGSSRPPRV